MGRRILAIDPGKRAGWALWTDATREGLLEASGVVDGDDAKAARCLLVERGPDLVVVEAQFFRPRGEVMGHKQIATLIRRMHIWTVCAELQGIPWESVPPATWQAFFHMPQRSKGLKPIIENVARRWAPACQPDEADAVLIGKRAIMLAPKP